MSVRIRFSKLGELVPVRGRHADSQRSKNNLYFKNFFLPYWTFKPECQLESYFLNWANPYQLGVGMPAAGFLKTICEEQILEFEIVFRALAGGMPTPNRTKMATLTDFLMPTASKLNCLYLLLTLVI